MTYRSFVALGTVTALATAAIGVIGVASALGVRAPDGPTLQEMTGLFAAVLVGLAVAGLSKYPTNPTVRVIAGVLALGALVLNVPLLVGRWTVPASSGVAGIRPLRGIIADLLAIATLIIAARGPSKVSNAIAVAVGTVATTILLGIVYGGPLIPALTFVRFSLASVLCSLGGAIAIIAANGATVWPTRLFIGGDVAATLRRWFLPVVVVSVLVTNIATVRVFPKFSQAIGSGLASTITLVVATIIVSYVGQLIGARLERSYKALRASEDKFGRVFESVPAGIAVSSLADGRFLDVNDEFTRIYGFTRHEAVGATSPQLGMWQDPSDFERFTATMKAGGEVRDLELMQRAKDGRSLIVRMAAHVVDHHAEPILLTSFVDDTARYRAEEALQQSERRFRQLFESVRDVVFSLDVDGTIAMLNPAFQAVTGFPISEWIGRPFIELVHPDDHGRALARFVGEQGQVAFDREPLHLKSRGGYWLSEISTAPLVEEGRVVSVFGIARDVSERVHLEEQLRQAQKMEALGRLAGGVAHDFNNLLTVIIGWGDLLLAQADPARPEAVEVTEMVKAARQAAEMTRQLLAFSRQQVIEPRDLNLSAVIGGLDRMLRRLIGEDVTLETYFDTAARTIRGDPGQLQQIIMNLAVNARDAMPRGGRLTIQTTACEVDAVFAASHSDAEPGHYERMRVSDTGAGISSEVAARIFEPFFTTKESGKGTGLGLSMVFGIVRQHRGFIDVRSAPGEGTTFDVYLPLVEAPSLSAPHAAPSIASLRGSATVLLVEDNASVRAITTRILRDHGYSVLAAGGGEEALELVQSHQGPIDLVITDVVMPEMSGPALADGLARVRPGLKLLFVSGYPDEVLTRHGLTLSDVALLPKPFEPAALAARVRGMLQS